MRLSGLPNIGKLLEKELQEAGISDAEELVAMGAVEAARRISLTNEVCANKLYALEGAVRGVRWHSISKENRAELISELNMNHSD